MELVDKRFGRFVRVYNICMKTYFKIGDKVYYKRLVNSSAPLQYIIRKGIIRQIQVGVVPSIPSYQVDSPDVGITFVLPEYEVYETQKEVLKSIQ